MSVTVPSILANVTLAHLNLTANCSNLAIGFQVWNDDFEYPDPTPGNSTTDDSTADDGPEPPFYDIWYNGTSPEFTEFWRSTLGSVLPHSYLNFTDAEIAAWTNHTEFYDFFNLDTLYWPYPDQLSSLANSLASSGGCENNGSTSQQGGLTYYSKFQQACMVQYCCKSTGDTHDENSMAPFPYFPDWTIQDACAFDTCKRANAGNPDLGGIGVVTAYIIEASLIFLSLVFFGIKFITDWLYSKRDRSASNLIDQQNESNHHNLIGQHTEAVVAAAGVFVDNSVFFSFAINFASIIFNSRGTPLLYEDKLGQSSSLVGINAPVSILLMCYHVIDRRSLRIFLVSLAALMTFIIQFLFRRAKSFNPGTSLCFAWDDYIQKVFTQRFEAKAVWAGLVVLYILWAFSDFLECCVCRFRRNTTGSEAQDAPNWQSLGKPRGKHLKVLVLLQGVYQKVPWRRGIAYLLAAYGLFAIIIEIRFIFFLRHQEKDIASSDDEDRWGYGQILALFVWVPVFVEYVYILGRERLLWGQNDRYVRNARQERRSYEMVRPIYYESQKQQRPEEEGLA